MMDYEEIKGWLAGRHILVVMCDHNEVEDRIRKVFEQHNVRLTVKHCISDGLYELGRHDRGFDYDLVVTYVALPRTNDYYTEMEDSNRHNDSSILEKGGIEMVQEWHSNLGYTSQIPVLYLATTETAKFQKEGLVAAGIGNSEWSKVSEQANILRRITAKLISEAPIGRDWLKDLKKD